MIDHDVLTRVLGAATKGGADFAEVFAEDKRSTSAGLDDGRIEQVTSGRDRGAGIRVVNGDTTGFAHTADLVQPQAHRLQPLGQGSADALPCLGPVLLQSAQRRLLLL